MGTRVEADVELVATVVREELDRRRDRVGDSSATEYAKRAEPLYRSGAGADAFEALDRLFFHRLGLGRPLVQAVERSPGVRSRAEGVRFALATAGLETTDLGDADALLVAVRVRPSRFADRDALAVWLDHELGHAEDLLDDDFGFDGRAAAIPDPAVARRYHLLWCAAIDGRLHRRGREPRHDLEHHTATLRGIFPALSPAEAAARTALLWDAHASHEALMQWASAVRSLCPICRFPQSTLSSLAAGEALPDLVTRARARAPAWSPEDGLCIRCREFFLLPSPGSPRAA